MAEETSEEGSQEDKGKQEEESSQTKLTLDDVRDMCEDIFGGKWDKHGG